MKKILITGASGFIGSFLIEEALKQGYETWAGIRHSSKKTYLADNRINFLTLTLSNKEELKFELRRHIEKHGTFDYIIHNAGITKTSDSNAFQKVNTEYTKKFVEALRELDAIPEKFIYMSSLAACGPSGNDPANIITDRKFPDPISLYGKSKRETELYLESLSDFPYVIIRPTGVYGPREKDYLIMYKALNRHLETYIGSRNQRLTFIYVKDLARLVFNAMESSHLHKAYFATDGNYYTAKQFSEIVKKELNKKTITITFPKNIVKTISQILGIISKMTDKTFTLNPEKYKEISNNWLCNGSNTFNELDFVPEYNLEKGINETIDWCKQQKLL